MEVFTFSIIKNECMKMYGIYILTWMSHAQLCLSGYTTQVLTNQYQSLLTDRQRWELPS